jgi:pilus assembly protein CpaC
VFPGAASISQPFGSLLANVINVNGVRIDTLISALEDKGLVKTLAEPNLISQSGQRAQFFAGTEIPIPTVQPGTVGTTPTVTTTYYPCGVTLGFEPTVLNTGLINLHLTPQVCEVAQTTVAVNGTTIPELTTRSADTDVELRDGQSFAIAGLLQAQDVNQLSQLPWFGNVPVLGALFRSTNYQKADTDLVVIVTVHLVKPAAPGTHLATPFDNTLPANDVDLFLMGQTERKKKYTEFVTSGGGMQGPYGHVLEAK